MPTRSSKGIRHSFTGVLGGRHTGIFGLPSHSFASAFTMCASTPARHTVVPSTELHDEPTVLSTAPPKSPIARHSSETGSHEAEAAVAPSTVTLW